MAIPILHAKAKEELLRFMKQLTGHYLLKENSSSAAGPTIFKCFPLLQEHSNWRKNSTAAINLIQKDLYLSLGLKVLYSFPRRFSLTCVNSYSSTDTQSLPYHLIAWMTLVNQMKINELSGYTWGLQSYFMPRSATAWLATRQEWKS